MLAKRARSGVVSITQKCGGPGQQHPRGACSGFFCSIGIALQEEERALKGLW